MRRNQPQGEYISIDRVLELIEEHKWKLAPKYTRDEKIVSIEVNRTLELLKQTIK